MTKKQEPEPLIDKISGAKVVFSVNIGSQLIDTESGEDELGSSFHGNGNMPPVMKRVT